MREKHLMGPFESSSKTPRKGPIKCFSQIKKKLSQTCRISSILVFLCTYGLHTDTKSSKTSQSHRKTPQNGRFWTVGYLLWRPYAKIYQKDTRNLQETHRILFETHRILFKTHRMLFKTHRILFKTKIYEKKYKKSASSYHTQTGYISRHKCNKCNKWNNVIMFIVATACILYRLDIVDLSHNRYMKIDTIWENRYNVILLYLV